MSTNTKILPPRRHDMAEQSHDDRIEICAQLGQIVPIDKKHCLAHYEGIVAELRADQEGV